MSKNNLYIAGLAVYLSAIVLTSALLIVDSFSPIGLNANAMILPFVAALFIGALGIGYRVARKGSTKFLAAIGTVAVAILLTFVGFFAVAAVAWCIALAHAGEWSETHDAPVFVFNQEKAPDWWSAQNYNAQASANEEEYKGDTPINRLPVANVHVFKGTEGDGRTDCFVSFSYYNYKTDLAKLKTEKDANMPSGDLHMNGTGNTNVTLSVFGDSTSILMNNYELSGAGSEDSMRGMNYGWVEAGDGFVEVSGVCPATAELSQVAQAANGVALINQ